MKYYISISHWGIFEVTIKQFVEHFLKGNPDHTLYKE